MKLNITKFSLTLFATFTLVACGSSGNNTSSQSVNPTQPVQPSTPSAQPSTPSAQPSTPSAQPSTPSVQPSTPSAQPSTPSAQPSTPSTSKEVAQNTNSGSILSITDSGVIASTMLNDSKIKTLDIDGKKIDLLLSSPNYSNTQLGNELVQVGYLDPQVEGLPHYIFYNGEVSKNIPNKGEASYSGTVLIAGSEVYNSGEKGDAKLRVDFDSKKLDGRFIFKPNTLKFASDTEEQIIQVNADISGSNIVGKAVSKHLSGEAKVEAKFYGNNAEAIVGAAYKSGNESWFAPFATKKDK